MLFRTLSLSEIERGGALTLLPLLKRFEGDEVCMNQPTHSQSATPSLQGESFPGGKEFREEYSGISFTPDQERLPNSRWYKCTDPSLVGLLTTPNGMSKGALVLLGGSEGGVATVWSDYFASKGFTSFAIGYHKGRSQNTDLEMPHELSSGVPEHLENIGLHKLAGAIEWFRRLDPVRDQPVILLGASRGGELVLILASMFPESCNKVVSLLPCAQVIGAYSANEEKQKQQSQQGTPAWVTDNNNTAYDGNKGPSISEGEGDLSKMRRGAIPVENISAPILTMSFTDDYVWLGVFWTNETFKKYCDAEEILRPRNGFNRGDVFIRIQGEGHFGHPLEEKVDGSEPESKLIGDYREAWLKILEFIEPTISLPSKAP